MGHFDIMPGMRSTSFENRRLSIESVSGVLDLEILWIWERAEFL